MNTLNGIPVHPLLVHAVVVFLPLAAFLTVLSVAWPAARLRLGFITPLVAVGAFVMVPITTSAGEWLEHHMPSTALLRSHTELGDQVAYGAAPLALFAVVFWALHTPEILRYVPGFSGGASPKWAKLATTTTAALAVVFALVSTVLVFRAGDSGAQAAWSDVVISK